MIRYSPRALALHSLTADTRCEDGRLMRSDPQHDDPYLETDIGRCPVCNGKGCDRDIVGECDCCGAHDVKITFVVAYGIDTYACSKCRGYEEDDDE